MNLEGEKRSNPDPGNFLVNIGRDMVKDIETLLPFIGLLWESTAHILCSQYSVFNSPRPP